MAQFPCDRCGQRYRGPQQTVYPALVAASRAVRKRMRLCPLHFDEVVSHMFLHEEATGASDLHECSYADCREPADVAVFGTVYESGRERADYYYRSCVSHATREDAVMLFGSEILPGTLTDGL